MRFCKVLIDGRAFGVKIKLSRWLGKNHDNCASARNPIDFVSAAGTVRVPQNLISRNEFTRIDFRTDREVVRVAKGNREPIRIYYAKQAEMLIRSELGEAN